MPSYHKRRDAVQSKLTTVLQAFGWSVHDTSGVGGSFPDAVCARNGYTVLVEFKSAKGELSDGQKEFHLLWPGRIYVVRTSKDIEAMTKGLIQ